MKRIDLSREEKREAKTKLRTNMKTTKKKCKEWDTTNVFVYVCVCMSKNDLKNKSTQEKWIKVLTYCCGVDT